MNRKRIIAYVSMEIVLEPDMPMYRVGSAQEFIAGCNPDLVLLDPYAGSECRWDVLATIRGRHVQLAAPPFLSNGSGRSSFQPCGWGGACSLGKDW